MKHPVDAIKQFIPLTEDQEAQLRKICDAEVCSSCGREILKWTSDLPTQEGWYWLKEGEFKQLVYVRSEGELVFYEAMSESDRSVSCNEGEWYGPIEPPEYPLRKELK